MEKPTSIQKVTNKTENKLPGHFASIKIIHKKACKNFCIKSLTKEVRLSLKGELPNNQSGTHSSTLPKECGNVHSPFGSLVQHATAN